jgi:hypothetical protein
MMRQEGRVGDQGRNHGAADDGGDDLDDLGVLHLGDDLVVCHKTVTQRTSRGIHRDVFTLCSHMTNV